MAICRSGGRILYTRRQAGRQEPDEEIMFMFAISGVIYYNTLSESTHEKILGIPERWFWAVVHAAFCVFVEVLLNLGSHLIWEYPW